MIPTIFMHYSSWLAADGGNWATADICAIWYLVDRQVVRIICHPSLGVIDVRGPYLMNMNTTVMLFLVCINYDMMLIQT
jgi:hypothetical protein